jgi:hypothetical protein
MIGRRVTYNGHSLADFWLKMNRLSLSQFVPQFILRGTTADRPQPPSSLLDRLPEEVVSNLILPHVTTAPDLCAIAATEHSLWRLARGHVAHEQLHRLHRWLVAQEQPAETDATESGHGGARASLAPTAVRAAHYFLTRGPMGRLASVATPCPLPDGEVDLNQARQALSDLADVLSQAAMRHLAHQALRPPKPVLLATQLKLIALKDLALKPLRDWQRQAAERADGPSATRDGLAATARMVEWLIACPAQSFCSDTFSLHRVPLGPFGAPPLDVYLPQLTTVVMHGCRLTQVPNVLWRLPNLETLDLSANHLTTWPSHQGGIVRLKRLNLSFNTLGQTPPSLFLCTALEQLNLRDNGLATLDGGIAALQALTYLDVAHNPLTTLPPTFSRLTKLSHLDVRGVPLHDGAIPELTALPSLDKLWADGALMRALPWGLLALAFNTYLNEPS